MTKEVAIMVIEMLPAHGRDEAKRQTLESMKSSNCNDYVFTCHSQNEADKVITLIKMAKRKLNYDKPDQYDGDIIVIRRKGETE